LENLAVMLVHFIEISEVYVAGSKHLSDKKEYWQNELKSLGIEPRRQNELNDKEEELQALAESIKELYY
jgi:coenzyme F420-reducing hydrogenase delta subunit